MASISSRGALKGGAIAMFRFAISAFPVTAALVAATMHFASAMPMRPLVNVSATSATSASKLAANIHSRPLARRCVPPPCPAGAKAGFPRRQLTS